MLILNFSFCRVKLRQHYQNCFRFFIHSVIQCFMCMEPIYVVVVVINRGCYFWVALAADAASYQFEI